MEPQAFSHFPTWPLPLELALETTPRRDCSYLPGRVSAFRAFEARRISGEAYQQLMDAGFRRSGSVVYQPMCPGCRACVPLRVPVARFVPSRSQRRVSRRNRDVVVRVGSPTPTRLKWEIYEAYQKQWHGKPTVSAGSDVVDFVGFLYSSPVDSLEFEYYDRWERLLGVGICDLCPQSLSSVYFYFDPSQKRRSLGTFSAVYEIQWARQAGLNYWYAGYWIEDCPSMAYKSRYRPCEALGTDGIWREIMREAGRVPKQC